MSNEAKLGTVPVGDEGRDAVHVAIVPCRAAELLFGGDPVRINAEKSAESCSADEAVGVVDPFRTQNQRAVAPGEWFWLCLYPKTITGLRHVWEHPGFPEGETAATSTIPVSEREYLASVAWIEGYVRKHCGYWKDELDGGYEKFMRYVKGDRWIYYAGSDCHSLSDVADAEELFRHLSVVLGMRIDAAYFEAFKCSC